MDRYWPYLTNKRFIISTAIGLVLLAAGTIITYFAIVYATERASGPVTDLILDNIPVFNMDGSFIWGPVIFWVIIGLYALLIRPQSVPFSLKSIALFLLIRAAFITLTHIGPSPDQIQLETTDSLFNVFMTGNDLFFSGHTGLPFLIALVFWHDPWVRWFCLASSVFFGAVVLMSHLHYSIDVFAAFFITYAIFHISEWLFKEDRRIFKEGIQATS